MYWCVHLFVWQVELFEFHGEDITEEEDGGIIRRIITKGEGYTKPNEGASVEGRTLFLFLQQSAIHLYQSARVHRMNKANVIRRECNVVHSLQ